MHRVPAKMNSTICPPLGPQVTELYFIIIFRWVDTIKRVCRYNAKTMCWLDVICLHFHMLFIWNVKNKKEDDKKTAEENQWFWDKQHAQEKDKRCIRCGNAKCKLCDLVMDCLLFICHELVSPLSSPTSSDAKYRYNSKANKYAVCDNP